MIGKKEGVEGRRGKDATVRGGEGGVVVYGESRRVKRKGERDDIVGEEEKRKKRTKSRATAVPWNFANFVLLHKPWKACPNSWQNVTTSL
jgi:hypothetical protein